MRSIQAPIPDPTTQPFWDACREGRLMIGLCRDTGRHFFPPRGVSPFILSPRVELVPASGLGTLYSFMVMRVAEPYIAAMVELVEGPRLFTNLVEVAPEQVRIGMALRLVFTPTEGSPPVQESTTNSIVMRLATFRLSAPCWLFCSPLPVRLPSLDPSSSCLRLDGGLAWAPWRQHFWRCWPRAWCLAT